MAAVTSKVLIFFILTTFILLVNQANFGFGSLQLENCPQPGCLICNEKGDCLLCKRANIINSAKHFQCNLSCTENCVACIFSGPGGCDECMRGYRMDWMGDGYSCRIIDGGGETTENEGGEKRLSTESSAAGSRKEPDFIFISDNPSSGDPGSIYKFYPDSGRSERLLTVGERTYVSLRGFDCAQNSLIFREVDRNWEFSYHRYSLDSGLRTRMTEFDGFPLSRVTLAGSVDFENGRFFGVQWTGTLQYPAIVGYFNDNSIKHLNYIDSSEKQYATRIIYDRQNNKLYSIEERWRAPGIYRMDLGTDSDGKAKPENVEMVVNGTDRNICKYTADFERDELYWTDSGTRTIERSRLGGTNHEILYTSEDDRNYFCQISLLNDHLYSVLEDSSKPCYLRLVRLNRNTLELEILDSGNFEGCFHFSAPAPLGYSSC